MNEQMQVASDDLGSNLREQTAAVKLSRSQFGRSRSLTNMQVAQAAEEFNAKPRYLAARKKLLNDKHPKYKAVTSILSSARSYWEVSTVPYPEPGIRLIRRDRIEAFDDRMNQYRLALQSAVLELEAAYEELREQARVDLGDLFSVNDYPESIKDEFAIDWEYPPVDPPEYLKKLSPKLYEQQQAAIQARFDSAVAMAEQDFASELAKLVSHLSERLEPDDKGEKKVFKASAVENLSDFFNRFKALSVNPSGELAKIVAQAEEALKGTGVKALRNDVLLRDTIKEKLGGLSKSLEPLLVKQQRSIAVFDDEEEEAEQEAGKEDQQEAAVA